ncbi:hypothetical protein J6TS7_08350 [Paenibacillus dendritiformis]|uniref:alpha/beta fold hydrolase n=1 Tax=Paenibacillus TaxID=44249 RepID=UPI001B10802F|nr:MULTISPECIES: alpha/beta hydrolase [Paenibacillus]MEB9894777.1 alpha/beta hydrolase [Bacillus cereus]GIO77225.1 hypothetical protein J6TS7_08350 [Paenibacillus dendritiformis]
MNSSYHWDVALERLDPRYKLYAIDLRGFGISTYHQPIRALRDFADDVKLFARELGLDRFAVMGCSTGGGVAMELAADWPEAVTKLILLASVSTRDIRSMRMAAADCRIGADGLRAMRASRRWSAIA